MRLACPVRTPPPLLCLCLLFSLCHASTPNYVLVEASRTKLMADFSEATFGPLLNKPYYWDPYPLFTPSDDKLKYLENKSAELPSFFAQAPSLKTPFDISVLTRDVEAPEGSADGGLPDPAKPNERREQSQLIQRWLFSGLFFVLMWLLLMVYVYKARRRDILEAKYLLEKEIDTKDDGC